MNAETSSDGRPDPKVFLTEHLRMRLAASGLNEQTLRSSFLDWKHRGQNVKAFGRDAAGMGIHPNVRHVHLIPLNDPDVRKSERWERDFQKGLKDRTSDRCLLYVDGTPSYGYLLLSISNDPGGHSIWANTPFVSAAERMADAFHHFGKLPQAKQPQPPLPGVAEQ